MSELGNINLPPVNSILTLKIFRVLKYVIIFLQNGLLTFVIFFSWITEGERNPFIFSWKVDLSGSDSIWKQSATVCWFAHSKQALQIIFICRCNWLIIPFIVSPVFCVVLNSLTSPTHCAQDLLAAKAVSGSFRLPLDPIALDWRKLEEVSWSWKRFFFSSVAINILLLFFSCLASS